jgi:outer membrane translocation and assembly module TamA
VEVTVVTSLFAVGDVNVDSRQLMSILATKLSNASVEKLRRYIFCLFGCFSLNIPMYAQQLYKLQIAGDPQNILEFKLPQISPKDSLSISTLLQERVEILREEGYWLISLDGIEFENDSVLAKVFIGEKYNSLRIIKSNLGDRAAKRVSLHRLPEDINLIETFNLKKNVIDLYENMGFPFANVKLDSFQISGSRLDCQLIVDPGSQINFDSLKLSDDEIVKPSFISRYLNIFYDEPFSHSEVENISRRFRHLPYLNLDGEPSVYFALQKAKIKLEISRRKTNSFDGIIGLVPGTADRSSDVNGEFNLQLKNLFKTGKSFGFHWKKITTQTQQLNVNYKHPYVLGSPLQLELAYNQLKEGTLFSNRQLFLGFNYNWQTDVQLSFFYENKDGNRVDETSIENGDFSLNNYGLELEINKLDIPSSPKNGYLAVATSSIGLKNISDNSLNGEDQKKTNQYQFSASLSTYYSVKGNSVFHFRASGGLIENPRLFLNDLYRIGGLQTLRGFNENFFFATKYALVNAEWQLYFEETSYLFLFFDQALIEERIFIDNRFSQPSGMGLGLRISSSSGFFNLVYGLGRVHNGFSFDQSKIHFGYTGNF